jgi:ribosome biogenesis ATPase
MSAAEAGHLAAMATARYSRLREIEREKSGGKRKGGRREKKRRRRDGADGGAEFGEDDFVAAYLPGGPKYRRGGSGNGPGDPFGLQNGDPGEDGFRDGGAGSSAFAPSAPREVSLSDLGGIEESLTAIRELILCPLTHPELYGWLGVDPPRGVLLHGPPGMREDDARARHRAGGGGAVL